MRKVMRTATSYIVLISAILSHGSSFGADVSNSARKDHVQHGIVASAKRSIRKVYDCMRGNADTCTADEIMATRALLIVLVSKYIIVPMHTALAAGAGCTVTGGADASFKQRVDRVRASTSKKSIGEEKETECCVCFEDAEGLGDIPCVCDSEHAGQICYDCLHKVSMTTAKGPTCGKNLNL